MVDVVEKPDCDPALMGCKEGGEDERARIGLEADVVQRKVEAFVAPATNAAVSRAMAKGDWPPSLRSVSSILG